MVLENLGQSLRDVLKKIVNASNIDEKLVKEITKDSNTMVYELRVAQTDIGKVIGKKGRTAQALRTLLAAAGSRQNKRTELEIIE